MMESSRYDLAEEDANAEGPSATDVENMIDRFVLEQDDDKADAERHTFNEESGGAAAGAAADTPPWWQSLILFLACSDESGGAAAAGKGSTEELYLCPRLEDRGADADAAADLAPPRAPSRCRSADSASSMDV